MVDTTKNTKLFTTYGVTTAKATTPEIAAKLISKAKRPLIVVGTKILDPELLARVVKIAQKTNIPIAATGSSMPGFVDKDVNAKYINLHQLGFLCNRRKRGQGLMAMGPMTHSSSLGT